MGPAAHEAHPVVAVGAVVVSDDRLLMVKRSRPPAADLWTLPGGRVEPGEALSAAVAREVKEETGLDVKVGEVLGVFEAISEEHHYVILDHLATVDAGGDPIAGDDAAEVAWVPLGEVASLPCTPRLVETLTAWTILPG